MEAGRWFGLGGILCEIGEPVVNANLLISDLYMYIHLIFGEYPGIGYWFRFVVSLYQIQFGIEHES